MHTAIGKLHALVERESRNPEASVTNNADMLDMIRAVTNKVPHYVTDPKLIDLIAENKVQKGFVAMVRAGIHQLPFDPIMIEFEDPGRYGGGRCFVRMQSKPLWPPSMKIDGVRVHGDLFCYPLSVVRYGDQEIVAMMDKTDPVIVDFTRPGDPRQDRPYGVFHGSAAEPAQEEVKRQLALDVAEAVSIALLLLNTRGIEKLPVDTAKLNKARGKSGKGKLPIAPYTVIRIGHIYDRYGNAHAIAGSGRHMPVHWRAGHVREVRYGPMGPQGARIEAELRPTRPMFIPPCLVNYEGDGEAPQPKREVKL